MHSVVQRTHRGCQTKGKYTTGTSAPYFAQSSHADDAAQSFITYYSAAALWPLSFPGSCNGRHFAATSVVSVTNRLKNSKRHLVNKHGVRRDTIIYYSLTSKHPDLLALNDTLIFILALRSFSSGTVLSTIIYASQLPLDLQYAHGAEKSLSPASMTFKS